MDTWYCFRPSTINKRFTIYHLAFIPWSLLLCGPCRCRSEIFWNFLCIDLAWASSGQARWAQGCLKQFGSFVKNSVGRTMGVHESHSRFNVGVSQLSLTWLVLPTGYISFDAEIRILE